MRILMIPVGSAGDVHPHVGIGLALQRRGHDVSVLTSAYFEPLLARVGLPLIPIPSLTRVFLSYLESAVYAGKNAQVALQTRTNREWVGQMVVLRTPPGCGSMPSAS